MYTHTAQAIAASLVLRALWLSVDPMRAGDGYTFDGAVVYDINGDDRAVSIFYNTELDKWLIDLSFNCNQVTVPLNDKNLRLAYHFLVAEAWECDNHFETFGLPTHHDSVSYTALVSDRHRCRLRGNRAVAWKNPANGAIIFGSPIGDTRRFGIPLFHCKVLD